MIRLLKNMGTTPLYLYDFQGITLGVGESTDGMQFGATVLRDSLSIAEELLIGTLVVNDGFTDYKKLEGVDLIRGTASQITLDGKPIVTMSDRPKDTFRHVTSRGDDLVGHKVGEGTSLSFNVAPGVIQNIDVQFIEDIFMKDGYCVYGGSTSNDSWLSVLVVCPAGVPFPSAGKLGNFDLVGSTWTPNNTNTGAYFILGVETVISRFGNHLPLITFNTMVEIESTEPTRLPTPYILRIVVDNGADSTSNLIARVYVGCYRKTTIN
jgi:hypothetical protein